MTSDDLAALAAISLGALVAVTATVTLIDYDPTPGVSESVVWMDMRAPTSPTSTRVVDFAIIRDQGDLMVGPEGPGSGWSPPPASGDHPLGRR